MILQLHNYPIEMETQSVLAATPDQYVQAALNIRHVLLFESDWTMVPDSPLSESMRLEWATWRQAMRDLPLSFPEVMGETLEIPEPPTAYRPESWVNVTPDAPWMNMHTHDDGTTHSHS